jgi:hypothetical protein
MFSGNLVKVFTLLSETKCYSEPVADLSVWIDLSCN